MSHHTRLTIVSGALLFAAPGLAATQARDAPSTVTAELRPKTVVVEVDANGQYLNFDVLLNNRDSDALTLVFLEMEAYDDAGRFLMRRQMGSNGLPGAISTIPHREVPAGGATTIFNPFVRWPRHLPMARIRLTLFFDRGPRLTLDTSLLRWHPDVPLRLPFERAVVVEDGNDFFSHHRRVSLTHAIAQQLGMEVLTQRFAIDFTVIDDRGARRRGPGEEIENWYAWDTAVFSPAEGMVVYARGDVPDNRIGPNGSVIKPDDLASFGHDASAGNYVVLRHDADEFTMLAHFREGTVAVRPGDRVQPGQFLGRLGLSGDTAYPHLHFQVQDGADILTSDPRPAYFECVLHQPGDVVHDGMARLMSGAWVGPCQ